MKQQVSIIAIFLFLTSHSMLPGHAHEVTFYGHNNCPFPIWPATAPNTGHPVVADGGFYLAPGETRSMIVPSPWNGRVWGRTGCNFTSNRQPACETGDCDGRLACNGSIGTPPVTLVQIALQAEKGKPNFYDVSLVDGYNLPISVTTRQSSTPKCSIGGCSKDLKYLCPQELQVRNKDGDVVACRSACLAFNVDSFCCRNQYGTPEKCKPTVYSKIFKDACPSYYSYAYDRPPPLINCEGKEYVITFCPSAWGTAHTTI
ncbi:Thaumatin domain-containing protein [Cephalotus follicularis]|uniref:Thaumatin domain-containing protein n=1 Tax=Cephalotus follicularis TaxID=3775 RepID=A0A1Q3CY41_CEPFO|nr:Thaumatin domain-containing protein [Cephalotus follicularis]